MTSVSSFNLVIGLAGPYGAGCTSLAGELRSVVSDWPGFHVETIHVADLIKRYYPILREKDLPPLGDDSAERRQLLQNAGTELRQPDKEFIGKAIACDIFEKGSELEKDKKMNGVGTSVFIVDSLKNRNEVELLRRTYSNEFYLVFVHSDRETRWRREVDYKSWNEKQRVAFEERDQVDRDEKNVEPGVDDAGQQVGRLAAMADYYIVNNQTREDLKEKGIRFLEALLGNSRNQPTFDERSMHLAYSASNRSYCLSRQVGAVIVDNQGNVLGIGHNDVPKAGGGLYTHEDSQDKRCYSVGDRKCINDTNKNERFNELETQIVNSINVEGPERDTIRKVIRRSAFKEATEYCRAVHAEMEALLSVSRNPSSSTVGAAMYATTQPCHNCTKHLICAGLKKVVYIEPYPKSLAVELHSDAIVLDPRPAECSKEKVMFVPYQGIAPHRYHDFFVLEGERKGPEGQYVQRSKEEQANNPRFAKHVQRRYRRSSDPDPVTASEIKHLNEIAKLAQTKIEETKE